MTYNGSRESPVLFRAGEFVNGVPKDATVFKGGLQFIKGNSQPYFSLTSTTYENFKDVGGGAAGPDQLKLAPHLAPLAALHLSSMDGEPLHALANGWYWLAGAVDGGFGQQYHGGNGTPQKGPAECLSTFAKYVRITDEHASALRDEMVSVAQKDGNKAAREAFGHWIAEQKPRWAQEARECIETFGLQIYGDPWTPPADAAIADDLSPNIDRVREGRA